MEIEQAVKQHALAHPGLAGLIGGRLYYGTLPSPVTLPAVTYFLVSGARDHVTDRRSPRFQFTAWAANYQSAATVAAQVEEAFIRYRGMMAGEIPVIQGVVVVPGYDLPPETAPNGTRYGRAVDIQVHYKA